MFTNEQIVHRSNVMKRPIRRRAVSNVGEYSSASKANSKTFLQLIISSKNSPFTALK